MQTPEDPPPLLPLHDADTPGQCILTATRFNYSASVSFSSLAENNTGGSCELVNCRKQIQYSYMSELMECMESLIQLERVLSDFQTLSKIFQLASYIFVLTFVTVFGFTKNFKNI
jgi:hypothetical protein